MTTLFAEPKKSKNGLLAVIDIGATSLRLAIAQVDPENNIEILDSLSQEVNLGRDSFLRGRIRHETIEDCVRVLKIYRQKLDEYQVSDPRNVRVIATSAVREANNRLAFLDRIFVGTGFEVEMFDEAELHRVTYLSIEPILKNSVNLSGENHVVCEIGGGSTEVLALHNNDITFSQTYRMGALRLRKTLEALDAPTVKMRSIMQQQIDQTVNQLTKSLKTRIDNLILMGGDMRFAVAQLKPAWDRSTLARLDLNEFEGFVENILAQTPDQICQRFHISYAEAETLGVALLMNLHFAIELGVKQLYVANANLRDGLLNVMSRKGVWSDNFCKQVTGFALELGRKYHFDETHALHVAKLSDQLFEHLQSEHQLTPRHQVILHVAAILHEIGSFVANRSYHKHTMYLIQNSQFFGFGKRDILLTSLVARFHRRAHPQPAHSGYQDLDRENRVAVSKMAALLRIAIALDESRSQRIDDFEVSIIGDRVLIAVPDVADLSLEQVALRQYGTLFQAVFGKQVVLNRARV